MREWLVDSSVWIEFLRGTGSSTAKRLREAIAEDEPIIVPGLVRAELLRGTPNEAQANLLAKRFSAYPVANTKEPETYERAATFYRLARAKGYTVRSTVDCVLAALAAEGRYRLAHCDRDFEALSEVGGFEVERW
ncbi:MAG: PIN domain nuclease [Myxococcota bacterium]